LGSSDELLGCKGVAEEEEEEERKKERSQRKRKRNQNDATSHDPSLLIPPLSQSNPKPTDVRTHRNPRLRIHKEMRMSHPSPPTTPLPSPPLPIHLIHHQPRRPIHSFHGNFCSPHNLQPFLRFLPQRPDEQTLPALVVDQRTAFGSGWDERVRS